MDRPHSDNQGDTDHDPPTDDEAPTTPTDEPPPMPIQDPPENPMPPLTVTLQHAWLMVGRRRATVH
jgi:hypothetical protein